jgi:hypothetical protein
MNIDYTKLLPYQLRSTRWADIMTVVGSLLADIKVNHIDIIRTQNIIMQMTDDQLLTFASNFGYNITSSDGYTATLDYLRKEVYTIIPRILNRTTILGYNSVFTIFNLNGHVYPTTYYSPYLIPYETWITDTEQTELEPYTLDNDGDFILFYIGLTPIYDYPANSIEPAITLDDENNQYPTLDRMSILRAITRHLVIQYSFLYVENTTEFLSQNTLKAFYNDILNQKRRTEVVYYEPVLESTASSVTGTKTTTTLYNYDHSVTTYAYSILLQTNIGSVSKIRFGDNFHDIIDGSITDVKNFVTEILLSDCEIAVSTNTELQGRRLITQKCSFVNFTEIALFDSLSNCLYYATFPKIQYSPEMYSNIAFHITLS